MRVYLAIIATLLIAGAAWLSARRLKVAAGGVNAAGVVIGHETREDDGTVFHLPVVSFVDQRGIQHRFTSVAGRSHASPPIGAEVTVRYLPEDPGTAYVVSFLHVWAAPVGLFVLGIAAIAGSIQN